MPGGNGGRLVGFGQADGCVALPRTTLPVIGDLAEGAGTHRDCPGRNAETDRVPEGISEGFHPEQSGMVAPRGREPMAGRKVPITAMYKNEDRRNEDRRVDHWRCLSASINYDNAMKSERPTRSAVWRRRAGSNRCIAVLQTAPLTTWVRRPARIIAGLVPLSQRWT